MTVLYIIAVYCFAMGIIAAYIANKKEAGFFQMYLYVLGGPLTLVLHLLKLKTKDEERNYYRRKYLKS